MARNWIVSDWASNVCFKGREFESFDDAWEFIWQTRPEDEYSEYTVVNKKYYKIEFAKLLDPKESKLVIRAQVPKTSDSKPEAT